VVAYWIGEGTITLAMQEPSFTVHRPRNRCSTIPGRWLRGEVLPDEPVKAENQRVRIGTNDYVYDRFGVRPVKASQWIGCGPRGYWSIPRAGLLGRFSIARPAGGDAFASALSA
jgi:hypothetical protein